ncbi:unnamed protein product [Moneuplotes crassus]|uniref:AP2/ERF domain-containing protein n=1 Tax=Euplotes crassus TaxID=5936 RepID=A0AAD1Y6F0_EUPCR|nr:unnamed protein product [Moneuplotes crassus]
MNFIYVPVVVPQMMPILQTPQQIPDLSDYCQCSLPYPGASETRALIDKHPLSPQKDMNLQSTKAADPQLEEIKEKQKRPQLDPIPRKHKKKSQILQRLSSLCSASTILSDIDHILDPEEVVIQATPKQYQAPNRTPNSMRSRYIGVSYKSGKYNAYIVAEGRKTYICGTTDEETSARYYDYCAIHLHRLAATTNFSYTKRQLVEMCTSGDIYSSF